MCLTYVYLTSSIMETSTRVLVEAGAVKRVVTLARRSLSSLQTEVLKQFQITDGKQASIRMLFTLVLIAWTLLPAFMSYTWCFSQLHTFEHS